MSEGKFKFPLPDDVRRIIEGLLAEHVLLNDRPVFRDLLHRPPPRGENPLTDYLWCDPPRDPAEGLQPPPRVEQRPSERLMHEMRGASYRFTFRDDDGKTD